MKPSPCALTSFSPEFQLLCACCRVTPGEADRRQQRRLAPLVDADRVLELADRHRIAPLVHHHLRRHPEGTFPPALMQALARRSRHNALKTLGGFALNLRLARLLGEAGIPFLPLKGVTVAARYYGDAGLRHVNDLDFWIPPECVDRAGALLAGQGWRVDDHDAVDDLIARGGNHKRFVMGHVHHLVLVTPDRNRVEMHWRLTSNDAALRLDAAQLSAAAERVAVGRETLPLMAPESLLLYLCEHGARHGWYRLKWLADLPQVLESQAWDWPAVLRAARAANCRGALLTSLALAQALFGWTPPAEVAAAIRGERLLAWRLAVIRDYLLAPNSWWAEEPAMPLPVVIRHTFYRSSFAETLGFAWGEWRCFGLSHHDLRVVRLPDRCFPAYRLLRPLLFAWRRLRPLLAAGRAG